MQIRVGAAATVVTAAIASMGALGAPAATVAQVAAVSPIKHVVVIYQENHTFDNVLGVLCETRPTPCNTDRTGVPFNVSSGSVALKRGTVVGLKRSPDLVPFVEHTVAAQGRALDGRRMDGWGTLGGCRATDTPNPYGCLTYYTPNQVPNLSALARTYTVGDRMFSENDSPSWGGHLYPAAATLDGFSGDNPLPDPRVAVGPGWGCDSKRQSPWTSPAGVASQEPSCIPDYSLPGALFPFGGAYRATPVRHVPTIFDRLDAAGLSWRIYGQAEPKPGFNAYVWSICPSFAGCLYTRQVLNLVPASNVLADAAAGQLPKYSIVTPEATGGPDTSQHNQASMVVGDNWIGKMVAAIEAGPQARSTAIFITYDDCGCFYDHVAPGANPDGTRRGPRMPMVIVSPYARPGFTDSHVATFASILAFTEATFGLAPLSLNDAAAYDYAGAFDFTQVPLSPPRMVTSRLPAGEHLAAGGRGDDPT